MVFLAILPKVYDQASLFIAKIPKYELYIKSTLIPYLMEKIQMIDQRALAKFSNIFNDLTNYLLSVIFAMLSNLWDYAKITIDIMLFCILLPIISFYFLQDRNLVPKCFNMTKPFLNEKAANFILDCTSLITEFIRGQLNVCLIMMFYYAFFLSIMQIDFSLLLGIISGTSVAIPFVGILCSIILSSIITIVNFGVDYHLAYVLLLYVFGQLLEGYFITPRVIGNKIGLHPLLMILALTAFGKLFGIMGLFIAIPMTCILKTLFKHIKPYL
jgi:putative permease